MEQTVMVFADAAARTTALTGVVSEGMISYLKDTNAVEVYNGSAWVASDDPNAIQNTIVDAKGDLITATAADTPARLAVGSNGETLVADSSTSTGLKWDTPTGWVTLASGSFTAISTSLSSIPTTYKNLRLIIRDYYSTTADDLLYFRFNNVSTAGVYTGNVIYNSASTTFASVSGAWTLVWSPNLYFNNSNEANYCQLDLPDYASTITNKRIQAFYSQKDAGNTFIQNVTYDGTWQDTSAVTTILIGSYNGYANFTGSYVLLGEK
jgi:hypothetical protein